MLYFYIHRHLKAFTTGKLFKYAEGDFLDSDIASILIDASADVNNQGHWGTTSLMRAKEMKNHELVDMLIKAGADKLGFFTNYEHKMYILFCLSYCTNFINFCLLDRKKFILQSIIYL